MGGCIGGGWIKIIHTFQVSILKTIVMRAAHRLSQ